MITINREKWADCIDELMPLCEQVFALVEAKITSLPLDFDHELYNELDANDYCIVLSCAMVGSPLAFIGWLFQPCHDTKDIIKRIPMRFLYCQNTGGTRPSCYTLAKSTLHRRQVFGHLQILIQTTAH